jgi:hypothetical protein
MEDFERLDAADQAFLKRVMFQSASPIGEDQVLLKWHVQTAAGAAAGT